MCLENMKANPNIQIETPPAKTRAKSQNLEGKIQASIVKWFGETFPERRGALIAYFANPESKVQGGVMLSMGLMKDVSDLLYFARGEHRYVVGFEIKSEGTYHDVNHLRGQANWMLNFCEDGFFVDSLDMFQEVLLSGGDGISPNRVLENIKDVKTKTILWDKCKL